METKIRDFEMVELVVPANTAAGSRVPFDTIPVLRNQTNQTIYIQRMRTFLTTAYANSQKTPALPGLAAADLPKAVLVLYFENAENAKYIPLAMLNNIQDAASNPFQQSPEEFDNLQNVDWDKCYVQFSSAPNAASFVIPFGVSYAKVINRT